jgi:hypothetical protein
MRKVLGASLIFMLSLPALAHVTPNVTLLRRGDFVKQSFPAATKFFEKAVALDRSSAIPSSLNWTPTDEESKVYVARDDAGRLVGTAIFQWMPSQHGPVGVAIAFDPQGAVIQAAVTDVGTEPLAWVRPILEAKGLDSLRGLPSDREPDASGIGRGVSGEMSRYYAQVIAGAVARAQALERNAFPSTR